MPGPGGWWFPLSRWPTLIIYWWQENRGRPSQLLLPGTPLSVHTHTDTHNQTQAHLIAQSLTHACSYWKRLTPFHKYKRTQTKSFCVSPFFGVTRFCIALLLSNAILCCTFAPSLSLPPPPFSCLQLSFFHLLLWCYWLCHTGTDRRRDRGWEGECESSRVVCHIFRVCKCCNNECAAAYVRVIFWKIRVLTLINALSIQPIISKIMPSQYNHNISLTYTKCCEFPHDAMTKCSPQTLKQILYCFEYFFVGK